MIIGIFGLGVVGGTLAKWLETYTKHEIRKVDPEKGLNDPISDCHCIFMAVPVPTMDNGLQDRKILVECIKQTPYVPIFIRSTVLPGTCNELSRRYHRNVIACPEFLTESRAEKDMYNMPILTGADQDNIVVTLLENVFPDKEMLHVKNTEAELGKYWHNIHGAIDIHLANIIYRTATKENVNFRKAFLAARIGGQLHAMYSEVPGPDKYFGFGGKCFPKDLKAFARSSGSEALNQIYIENKIIRGKKEGENL